LHVLHGAPKAADTGRKTHPALIPLKTKILEGGVRCRRYRENLLFSPRFPLLKSVTIRNGELARASHGRPAGPSRLLNKGRWERSIMAKSPSGPDNARLDRIVAEARRNREQRENTYREQALKLYPWICGRCQREFDRTNLQQLTVHHRDHNHDNNPNDGSNWELLCIYCHENEHARFLDSAGQNPAAPGTGLSSSATHNPFADLKSLLNRGES
jgi:hypothetical protein